MARETSKAQVTPKRQCWECLRRRLVCDFSRPACNKCCAAGVVCPGYDERKPLTWLTPGQVTSRSRRRPPLPGAGGTRAIVTPSDSGETTDRTNDPTQNAESGVMEATVPHIELRSETCTVVRAVYYYNSFVYPDIAPMHQLAPNPYITLIPLETLHLYPVSICHTLVCLALSHRIHQLLPWTNRCPLTEARTGFHHHRDIAIRALNQDIGEKETCSSDATIVSVVLFLIADIRQSSSPNWRSHFAGATQLIMLRGGLEKLFHSASHLKSILLWFMIIAVVGNTTSPSFDQILATSHPDLTDLMLEMYGDGLNPALLCPPPLFLDIIKINHLRFQGRNASLINESTQSAANVLLMQIDRLSPEKWIKSDTSLREEWLLLGRIYQSAVALYCILSLQSVSVLPSTLQLNAMRTRHGGHLFPLLKKALASQRIKKCMLWPLVVAGVDAANYGPAAREFVNKHLLEMSQDLGTPVPLLAKVVLKRFWASGKTRWDDCFDRPYAFVA